MSKKDRFFGKSESDLLSVGNANDGLILAVDDGSLVVELMLEGLRDSGYGILIAQDVAEAATLYREARPDLLICDIVMSKPDAPCLVSELQREFPNFKAVLMADCPSRVKTAFKNKASELGVVCVVEKPVNVMELLATAHLLMSDRDIFHTHIRASVNSVPQAHRPASVASPESLPKQ